MDRNSREKNQRCLLTIKIETSFLGGGSDERETGRLQGKVQPMCCFLVENQNGSLSWDVMWGIIIRLQFSRQGVPVRGWLPHWTNRNSVQKQFINYFPAPPSPLAPTPFDCYTLVCWRNQGRMLQKEMVVGSLTHTEHLNCTNSSHHTQKSTPGGLETSE